MNYSYDLLKQPWITVLKKDNEQIELNLRDILYQAHKIDKIIDPIPIVEFGLHRFLVALVMDIFHPKILSELESLLDANEFDREKVDAYFDTWEQCFDLFDAERPFLQTGDMDGKPKPLAALFPAIPSGTAVNHFHHRAESDFAVSPAAAARLLTTIAPFMTAGGAGLSPSINGSPPWYVIVSGKSLFHTLCLNCPVVLDKELTGDTPPAWRNPEPPSTDKRCTKTSLLEALTWRPRRIQLIPHGSGGICSMSGKYSSILVGNMKFKAGASCDFTWRDPNVPYKASSNTEWTVMRPQEGRDIWRDTGPLALLHEGAYKGEKGEVRFARPSVVNQFALLVRDNRIDRNTPLSLTAYGMRIKDLKMNFQEWRKESLEVPVPLVIDTNFQIAAQRAMDKADQAEYHLKRAIKKVYPRDASSNSQALNTLIANATRVYWSTLRADYENLLQRLAKITADRRDEHTLQAREQWSQRIREVALLTFDQFAGDLDTDAKQVRRLVEAYSTLRRSLETSEERAARPKMATN